MKRSLHKCSLTLRHIGHTPLMMDCSNLWKHCYRLNHASFHKVQMYVAYPYLHVTVSLHYLPRRVRSRVSCNKTPAAVIQSDPLQVCCHGIVTQSRPTVEQSARDFRNTTLHAKDGTSVNCKPITAWHYNCEPDSCAMWVSYQQKLSLQELNQLIGI